MSDQVSDLTSLFLLLRDRVGQPVQVSFEAHPAAAGVAGLEGTTLASVSADKSGSAVEVVFVTLQLAKRHVADIVIDTWLLDEPPFLSDRELRVNLAGTVVSITFVERDDPTRPPRSDSEIS